MFVDTLVEPKSRDVSIYLNLECIRNLSDLSLSLPTSWRTSRI
jgi:hypothetical protein